jgi:transposase
LRTRAQVDEAAQSILRETHAERWITVEVKTVEEHRYRQAKSGRPSENTAYVRKTQERPQLHWQSNAEMLQYDDRTDGIFPLVTNDKKMSLHDVLVAYKHQPCIEKRHEQLKSVLDVMPVNLKSPSRIEAFLFIYFVALLVSSLIEREVRQQMKTEKISSLPLYPEGRPCKAPTTDRILELFVDIRRHRLMAADASVQKRFYDDLTQLQRTVLRLFGISTAKYFSAGEEHADPPA